MNNITLKEQQAPETPTFETLPKYVGEILNRVNRIESKLNIEVQEPQQEELFSEFIPKSEVRGKFASSSTLWNWEKMGKLNSYGIGGKRFYKRSELESLMQPINKKGGAR